MKEMEGYIVYRDVEVLDTDLAWARYGENLTKVAKDYPAIRR